MRCRVDKQSGVIMGSERGSTLLVVLLVMVLLSTLVITYLERSRLAAVESRNQIAWLQAFGAARSAMALARERIAARPSMPGTRSLHDEWASAIEGQKVGPADFSLYVEDETGKLSIRGLLQPDGTPEPRRLRMVERLFRALELDYIALPTNLAAWLRDSKAPEYRPHSLLELTQVEGFSTEIVNRLRPHLTVETDGRININTASGPVLQALSDDITPQMAGALIAARLLDPFARPADIRTVDGFTDRLVNPFFDLLTVSGSLFQATAEGSAQNILVRVRATMESRGDAVQVMSWVEE